MFYCATILCLKVFEKTEWKRIAYAQILQQFWPPTTDNKRQRFTTLSLLHTQLL